MMKMMIKTKMGITQPIFKLGPPDFAQQQIFIIPTNEDNDDDYNDKEENNKNDTYDKDNNKDYNSEKVRNNKDYNSEKVRNLVFW